MSSHSLPQTSSAPRHPLTPGRFPVSGFETWEGLGHTGSILALARSLASLQRPVIVLTETAEDADQWLAEWRFFAAGDTRPVLRLPDWETLPYDVFSPHEDIISERLRTLYTLPSLRAGIVLVPMATAMQRLPPRAWLLGQCLILEQGQVLQREVLRDRLTEAGYQSVPLVQTHGEFSLRGEILDVFPMGLREPVRIEFLDDEIDSLRFFEIESQRSTEQVQRLDILPGHEFPLNKDSIKAFRGRYRAQLPGDPSQHRVYREISEGVVPAGIEAYLPLFFDGLDPFFAYCPDALIVQWGNLAAAAERFAEEIQNRYEQLRHQVERPLLAPEQLYLQPEVLGEALRQYSGLALGRTPGPLPAHRGRSIAFAMEPLSPLESIPGKPPSPTAVRTLQEQHPKLLLTAESAGRREALLNTLRENGLPVVIATDWDHFLAQDASLQLALGSLSEGFRLPEGTALVPESSLFGDRTQTTRRRRATDRDAETIIQNLNDLHLGAPVVHEENGVGRYLGLHTLEVNGSPAEFLMLEYADQAKLYVPVASLHLISRYTGGDADHAPLHRLGGEQWAKARRKAAEKAHDVAAELLEIHARRAARPGTVYTLDPAEYGQFAAAFPFEETEDQLRAITAVIEDLEKPQPMDRVICGDVGFGKTEVAMRAAFVAVANHRQVAVLVPTTLLAQQHHQNFSDRFAEWPIRIESLSRFRNNREQSAILEGLRDGTIDIVIGTHKLLQGTVQFANLGLVIVDEEQRFGVRHKEALKKLRSEVDLLTLTATPIPRTLNMTLSGLRDLSIIATPPRARLAIKTFVHEWNDALIQEACLREIRRGGQVYFLHNEVETIEVQAERLQKLVPGARIGIAHGQLRERELERIMLDFYHRRFNILVCTTIIETGIDVPTANTIIMNRADRLGLAQMHQLRGRVGRSHHRAYAYLLAPPPKSMTADARKRLEAISALEDLGVGFALASHDLEIRGAGELLGAEQSGQMHEVGFSMYNDLLQRAIRALRKGQIPALDGDPERSIEVELGVPALLPETYVPDVHTRLILYKRLASLTSEKSLWDLEKELLDRFGRLPDAARALLDAAKLRLLATPLGIKKIECGPRSARFLLTKEPNINLALLIQRVQQQPSVYSLDGSRGFRVSSPMETLQQRVTVLESLLLELHPEQKAG